MTTYPPIDLVAAVVGRIRSAMGGSLAQATTADGTVPACWADYAHQFDYPYAVVVDTSETYEFTSHDPETGRPTTMIADGMIQVAFRATDKATARALGRQCIAVLSDQFEELASQEGYVREMRPGSAASVVVYDQATQQPTAFERVINFHYKYQTYL